MNVNQKFRILRCDLVDGCVAILFGDGKSYIFAAEMLRAHLDEAEEITEPTIQ